MASASPIVFRCSCGQKLKATPVLAGREVKCPGCGQQTRVPAPVAPAPPRPMATNVFEAASPEIVLHPVSELPARVVKIRARRTSSRTVTIIVASLAGIALALGGSVWWFLGKVREISLPPQVDHPQPLHVADFKDEQFRLLAQLAYAHIQPTVSDALRAPSTAQFAETFEFDTRPRLAENAVTVRLKAWVESQNALGVPLRSPINALLTFDATKESWQTELLLLGDTYLVKQPWVEQVERMFAEYALLTRFSGERDRTSKEFTVRTDWWQLRSSAGDSPVTIDVLDGVDRVVQNLIVPAGGDATHEISQSGTFRLRVRTLGKWEANVFVPKQ
ncbi:MAG: hypothetical protein IPM64_17925 [Phycisphaerales bacterium]|nr:hypothetical protein [Phycisphaerales bacterium]